MMRFVLCDDDQLYTRMIELMLHDLGHEVVGVGVMPSDGVSLIRTARPDAVIMDLSMGLNHDFDVIAAGAAVGAKTIVFSQTADDIVLSRYEERPLVVFKPDLTDLERVVRRLALASGATTPASHERRERPGHPAAGRVPTGIGDAQAFYEALNEASPGDVLMSIEVPSDNEWMRDTSDTATRVRSVIRDTDRLLSSPWSVRVFLPGGEVVGPTSLEERLRAAEALPDGAVVRAIVLGPGESPAEAFDRLKSMGQGT